MGTYWFLASPTGFRRIGCAGTGMAIMVIDIWLARPWRCGANAGFCGSCCCFLNSFQCKLMKKRFANQSNEQFRVADLHQRVNQ